MIELNPLMEGIVIFDNYYYQNNLFFTPKIHTN